MTISLPVYYCLPSKPGLSFVDWKAGAPIAALSAKPVAQMKESLPLGGPKAGTGRSGLIQGDSSGQVRVDQDVAEFEQ